MRQPIVLYLRRCLSKLHHADSGVCFSQHGVPAALGE